MLNVEEITNFLNVSPEQSLNCYTWKLHDAETNSFLFLSLFTDIEFNGNRNNLISVQTKFGYFELHNFNEILFLEPNEIAFVQFDEKKINCLVVGKNCTCSLYSNIDREIIRSKMSEIDPAFLLSALQLALIDEALS
jgi:hypothetical protein